MRYLWENNQGYVRPWPNQKAAVLARSMLQALQTAKGLNYVIGPYKFLHKSVRDFIDTHCLYGQCFVPEIQLMRSTFMELKAVETRMDDGDFRDSDGLRREVSFMDYACQAEKKTNMAQGALVNEPSG
jgi:hypothetical protein